VSHDRYFLDAVVTSTLVFEADGQVRRHAGGFSDWLEKRQSLAVTDAPAAIKNDPKTDTRVKQPPRKLSYKLQRELDSLPAEIESLEGRVATLRTAAAEPDFYRQTQDAVQQQLAELQSAEKHLETLVERWGELESLAASNAGSPGATND
jgi:ATP-binding cassette subfamily F protein uup